MKKVTYLTINYSMSYWSNSKALKHRSQNFENYSASTESPNFMIRAPKYHSSTAVIGLFTKKKNWTPCVIAPFSISNLSLSTKNCQLKKRRSQIRSLLAVRMRREWVNVLAYSRRPRRLRIFLQELGEQIVLGMMIMCWLVLFL